MMFLIALLLLNKIGLVKMATMEDSSEYKAFTNVPSMPFGRSDMIATTFSASFFADNEGPRIYLTGGCIADQICNSTILDATLGSTNLACICPEITNRCNYFTPLTEKWHTNVASSLVPRYRHMAAAVNQYLFIAGGRALDDSIITTVERYDILTNTWTNPFNWTEGATSDGGAFGWNGKLYLVGGYNSDYSVSSNQLVSFDMNGHYTTSYPAMEIGRGDISVVSLQGDYFYVIDGFADDFCTPSTAVEMYSAKENTWKTIHNMAYGRGDLAVGVIDGYMFAVGGETKEGGALDPKCSHSVPVATVERLRHNHSSWVREEAIPQDLFRFIGGSFNDSEAVKGVKISPAIYLFGGQGLYNPSTLSYPIRNSTIKYVPYYIYQLTYSSSKSSGEVLSKGGIAGIVIAAVVVALCLCAALLAFAEYKRRGFYMNLNSIEEGTPSNDVYHDGKNSENVNRSKNNEKEGSLVQRFDTIQV